MAQHTGLPCGVVLPCSQPYVTAVGGTDFKTTGVIGDETVRSRAGYSDTRNTYSRSTRGVTLLYIYITACTHLPIYRPTARFPTAMHVCPGRTLMTCHVGSKGRWIHRQKAQKNWNETRNRVVPGTMVLRVAIRNQDGPHVFAVMDLFRPKEHLAWPQAKRT